MKAETYNSVREANSNAAVTAIMADAAAEATQKIELVEIGDAHVLSVPAGRQIQDIEKYLDKPRRTFGDDEVGDAESLLKLVDRFKCDTSLVKFSLSRLLITACHNYPNAGNPQWQDHTATWQLKKHRDLLAWERMVNKDLSQIQFIDFLEEHLIDVTTKNDGPSQSILQSVVQNLTYTAESKFQSKRDVSNGNYILHSDHDTKSDIAVPQTFDIGVPIFEGLTLAYVVPIRLRWFVKDGTLYFRLLFTNLDVILERAWGEVTENIITQLANMGVPHLIVP